MVKLLLSVLSTLALSLVAYVEAAPTAGLQHVAPKVVALDFEVHHRSANSTISKRDDESLSLINQNTYYIAYLLFGSQKALVGVDIDTGSSDLWVPTSGAGSQATPFGSYNPSDSSTSQDTGTAFNVFYGEPSSPTYARGEYYTDTVSFADGSSTLNNLQFASVTSDNIGVGGILGVGLTSLEGTQPNYPNFPQALKDQGYINKNAYSLYLNSKDAATGSILFGGKDTAKIDGDLVTLPHSGEYYRLDATLNGVSFNGQSISLNRPYNFDSGTTSVIFDQDTFHQVATYLGWDGVSTTNQGLPIVTSIPSGSVSFDFNGISIEVPGSDFTFNLGNGKYELAIAYGDSPILGDPFLRNAYLVYDLEDSSISVGKVKFTDASNIVAL